MVNAVRGLAKAAPELKAGRKAFSAASVPKQVLFREKRDMAVVHASGTTA